MTPEQGQQAINITMKIKKDLRKLINVHGAKVNALSPGSDPHTPIIGCLQMALAQAATEYLMQQGCSTPEAIHAMTNATSAAMTRWLASLMKPVKGENNAVPSG